MKLNLGCGNNLLPGYVNIDITFPSVPLEYHKFQRGDLASSSCYSDIEDGSVTEILAFHLFEHLEDPLFVMSELYAKAKDGCRFEIRVPHGRSDEAWEDQTHKRAYFIGSFRYFSHHLYKFANYNYSANWVLESATYIAKPGSALNAFLIDSQRSSGVRRIPEHLLDAANQILEIRAVLFARKDDRQPPSEVPIQFATLNL